MWIRTQDKNAIQNFSNALSIGINWRNKKEIYIWHCGDEVPDIIGTYSTEQRTLEVFEELCEFTSDCEDSDKYYQMPEE